MSRSGRLKPSWLSTCSVSQSSCSVSWRLKASWSIHTWSNWNRTESIQTVWTTEFHSNIKKEISNELKTEINKIKTSIAELTIRTFANDTILFYADMLQELEQTINEEFSNFLTYFSANKLPVNFKKTQYIFSAHKLINLDLNIFLCVYINININWVPHIQHIKSKVSKNLVIIFKLRHLLPIKTLNQIYCITRLYISISTMLLRAGAIHMQVNWPKFKQNKQILVLHILLS